MTSPDALSPLIVWSARSTIWLRWHNDNFIVSPLGLYTVLLNTMVSVTLRTLRTLLAASPVSQYTAIIPPEKLSSLNCSSFFCELKTWRRWEVNSEDEDIVREKKAVFVGFDIHIFIWRAQNKITKTCSEEIRSQQHCKWQGRGRSHFKHDMKMIHFWLKAEYVNNLSYQVGVVEKSRGGSDVTEGYNTTLTFGEMVAIYHDIWNTMLIGSLSAVSWTCPESFFDSFLHFLL